MNRIPIIAGNWKMKLDTQATMLLPCEIIVAPPSLAVHAVQDVHWENNGAFTGKISARKFLSSHCPRF